ncbi:hypothetical protein [Siculibacillus lacustris]|uniref:hypothetical protein n=1 Tax=Siculibacillus lacustris TaxID=1549641 RepID=UPI0013F16BCB|nr:hypothetical protein [Siculibacillus lacustris]
MIYLVSTVLLGLVVAFVGAVVLFGYPALIVGALIGVALAFTALLAMTADGLRTQRRS